MIDVVVNVKILTNVLTKILKIDKVFNIFLKITIVVCAFQTQYFWGVTSGNDNDCQCFYNVNFVCAYKTQNFRGVISGSDNDCQCFYPTKKSDFIIVV